MTSPVSPDLPAQAARLRRRRVLRLVAFVGMIVSLGALLWWVDPRTVVHQMRAADARLLVSAALVVLLTPVAVAAKLWFVVRLVDEPRSLRRCGSAVLAAVALNSVLPGRGGDLVRAVFLADDPRTTPALVGAVLVERLIDVATLGALALVASALTGFAPAVLPALAACGAAAGVLVLLAQGHRVPLWPDLAQRVGQAATALPRRPGLVAGAVGFSALSWGVNLVVMALLLRAVGAPVPLAQVFAAMPIAILAGILPVSMAGIGTRDAAVALLLKGWAAPEQLVAASFLFTVLTMWFLGLLGVAALGRETLARTRRDASLAVTDPRGART